MNSAALRPTVEEASEAMARLETNRVFFVDGKYLGVWELSPDMTERLVAICYSDGAIDFCNDYMRHCIHKDVELIISEKLANAEDVI